MWGNSDFSDYGKSFFTQSIWETNPGVWSSTGSPTSFGSVKALAIPEQTQVLDKAISREHEYVTAALTTNSHTFILVLKTLYDGSARSHYGVYRTYFVDG